MGVEAGTPMLAGREGKLTAGRAQSWGSSVPAFLGRGSPSGYRQGERGGAQAEGKATVGGGTWETEAPGVVGMEARTGRTFSSHSPGRASPPTEETNQCS